MRTLEQVYGEEKALNIRAAVENGQLALEPAKVTIAAEKAKSTENVEIEYERIKVLSAEGALALYGAQDKVFDDVTYAWDLGIRSRIRQGYLSTITDPDKDLKKMAALGVKAGLYENETVALAALKALKPTA